MGHTRDKCTIKQIQDNLVIVMQRRLPCKCLILEFQIGMDIIAELCHIIYTTDSINH